MDIFYNMQDFGGKGKSNMLSRHPSAAVALLLASFTEHSSAPVNIPALYLVDSGFGSQPDISCLLTEVFLSLSIQILA
jgi:hypothetical protein